MSGYTDLSTNFENNRNCLRRIARHNEQEFSKDSIVNIMEKFVKTVNIMDDTILVPCRLMDRQVGDATDIIPAPAKSQLHHHHNSGPGHHHHHHHGNVNVNVRNRKDRNATVHEFLNSADLFNLYTMLNALKNDLLWTRNDGGDEEDVQSSKTVTEENSSTRQTLTSSVSVTESEASETCEQHQQPQKTNANRQNSSCSSSNVSESSATPASSATTQTIKGHTRRPSTASMASSNSTSNLSDSESEISNENDSGIEYEGHCSGSRSSAGSSTTSSNCKNGTNLDKATELARQCRTHLSGLYRCLEQMTEAANYLTARYQSDIGPV